METCIDVERSDSSIMNNENMLMEKTFRILFCFLIDTEVSMIHRYLNINWVLLSTTGIVHYLLSSWRKS